MVHKQDLFTTLKSRWRTPFGVTFEVVLDDLTSCYFASTYFESAPPASGKRRFGHSRTVTETRGPTGVKPCAFRSCSYCHLNNEEVTAFVNKIMNPSPTLVAKLQTAMGIKK